jgi:hypothetical protein
MPQLRWIRRAKCLSGVVVVEVDFTPRPEYGLVHPLLSPSIGGAVATGGPAVLVLSAPVPLDIAGSTATGSVLLREGASACFAVQHCARTEPGSARIWAQGELCERLDDTIAAWQSWSAHHQTYDGPWRDLVDQSGRVLQARPSCAVRSTERRPDDLDGASPQPDEAVFVARPRSRWKGAGRASPRAALPADDVAALDDVGGFAGVALEPLLEVSDSPRSKGGRRVRIAFVAVPYTITEQSST